MHCGPPNQFLGGSGAGGTTLQRPHAVNRRLRHEHNDLGVVIDSKPVEGEFSRAPRRLGSGGAASLKNTEKLFQMAFV